MRTQNFRNPDMDFSYFNSETSRLRIDAAIPPLDDIRVRKALNYAIDRDAIRGSILSKDVMPATQLVVPSINGHNPNLKVWPYDPEKAKKLLDDIAQRHGTALSDSAAQKLREAAKKVMIFYTKLTPMVYTTVKDCGVMLTIRYLCEPRKRRGSEQDIWEEILDAFAAHDNIDFAYPTQRFYRNDTEGKPGTRPEALYSSQRQEEDQCSPT